MRWMVCLIHNVILQIDYSQHLHSNRGLSHGRCKHLDRFQYFFLSIFRYVPGDVFEKSPQAHPDSPVGFHPLFRQGELCRPGIVLRPVPL